MEESVRSRINSLSEELYDHFLRGPAISRIRMSGTRLLLRLQIASKS